jgi:hypothetical protein
VRVTANDQGAAYDQVFRKYESAACRLPTSFPTSSTSRTPSSR